MAEVPKGLLVVTAGAQLFNSGEKAGIKDNREWKGKEQMGNKRKSIWANWKYRNMKLFDPDPRPRKLELQP